MLDLLWLFKKSLPILEKVNWPMLSAREALRRFPIQLRSFVLALMLIAFVAPTWHVCMMGGHSEHEGASHQSHLSSAASPKPVSAQGERQPLICYCATASHDTKSPEFQGAVLTSLPSLHEHPTCLALLLQAMPAVLAFSPSLHVVSTPQSVSYRATVYSFNSRFFALYNGRAPPVSL